MAFCNRTSHWKSTRCSRSPSPPSSHLPNRSRLLSYSNPTISPFTHSICICALCDVCLLFLLSSSCSCLHFSSSLLLAFLIYFSISFIAILLHLGQYLLNPFVLSIPRSTCQSSLLCAGLFSFGRGCALN